MNESLSGTTNMKMCDVCKKTQKKKLSETF